MNQEKARSLLAQSTVYVERIIKEGKARANKLEGDALRIEAAIAKDARQLLKEIMDLLKEEDG